MLPNFLDGKNDVVTTELKTNIRSIQNLKKNNFDLEKKIFLIFNLIIVRELCTNKRKNRQTASTFSIPKKEYSQKPLRHSKFLSSNSMFDNILKFFVR